MNGLRYHVFLSHNSADKSAVTEMARRLRDEAHLSLFLDKWHLVPGEPWMEGLEDALDASDTCAVFLGPAGLGTWENEEMRAALDMRANRPDFRVIPVLLPGAVLSERGRLPSFLSRMKWVDFRAGLDDQQAFHELVSGIKGEAPGSNGVSQLAPICPFRGLEVFDEEHAAFFFGREALSQHLIERLRMDRFLAVVGPSGSGKSSLVRAGLLPALRQGALDGSAGWPIVVFKPGSHPLESLAARLAPHIGGSSLLDARNALLKTLVGGERGLHSAVQTALAALPDSQRLVLVVDQFEEIFSFCRDEIERQRFVEGLRYASAIAGGQTVVVIAMRVDFFGKCAVYPDLATRLAERDVLVPPMDADDLRRAIREPAEKAGLYYDKGLIETILSELGDEPGILPLLQYTLLELWNRRRGVWLTTEAYRAMGGVRGALAQRADAAYERLTPDQQAAARRVLLRLTQPGEGTEDTRRRARLSELMLAGSGASDVEAVISALADERLLITSTDERGEEVVDVSHEALIRGWPLLQSWIETDREGLRIQHRLTEAATEWGTSTRNESYLYRGAQLAAAKEWAQSHRGDLNPLEEEFLEACVILHEREIEKELFIARKRAEEAETQRQAETQRAQAAESLVRKRTQDAARWRALAALLTVLLIGTGLVIWRTRPAWFANFTDDAVSALAASMEASPRVYAGTFDIGVASDHSGRAWQFAREGLPTGQPEGGDPLKIVKAVGPLVVDPLDPQHLFAYVSDNGIYVSSDGGARWQLASNGFPPNASVVAIVARGDLALAVLGGRSGAHLYATHDGAEWESVGSDPELPFGEVSAACITPDGSTIYLATKTGIYRSSTGGSWAWEAIDPLPEVLFIVPEAGARGDSYYLATYDSEDRSTTIYRWRPGSSPQPIEPPTPADVIKGYPIALTADPDPATSTGLFLLLDNNTLYAVAGDGRTKRLQQPPAGSLWDLLAVPRVGGGTRLLLAHDDGLMEYRADLSLDVPPAQSH